MAEATSSVVSETEELIRHLNSHLDFVKSAEFQESIDKSEQLNKIKVINSRLGSALGSLHGASTHTDGDVQLKSFLNTRQQGENKMAKHLAYTNIRWTKLYSLGTKTKMYLKQEHRPSEMDIQIQKEIHSIKQLIQQRESRFLELDQLVGTLTSNRLKDLEGNINSLQQIMQDLTTRVTSLDEERSQDKLSLNELSSRVASTEVALETLVVESKQENTLKDFEDRLMEAEANRRKDWNFHQQKLQDVESLYKQVCEMVAGQVTQLHHLQGTMNKNAMMAEKRQLQTSQIQAPPTAHFKVSASTPISFFRTHQQNLSSVHELHSNGENPKNLDSVRETVIDLLPRVSNLESRGRKTAVGFTAYLPVVTKMTSSVIKEFTDVRCNEGNCYNPTNGMFTAPQDGLYYASVTLRQRKEGKVDVSVLVKRPSSREMRIVGKSATHRDKKCSTAVGVVALKAGDVLFVRAVSVIPEAYLSQYSSFTCYLIG